MKDKLLTSLLFIFLVYAILEVHTFAFNQIFYSQINEYGLPLNYDDPWFRLLALLVSFFIFIIAGLVMAWRVQNLYSSTILAVLIGTLSLGIEYSFGTPWFLLMPSHPVLIDQFFAFAGTTISSLAGVLGVALFFKVFGQSNDQKSL
jgi:hypothetical protein